ncbi:MAG TPA: TIGR00300 family protein, partial [Candidatus Dormibacteraeota bacterium]|nr:TIGR00300 family protein [Candidatus Dormibacteraeota bacterium]
RAAGSLRAMVESGQLKAGVMKSAIDHGVEIVLAGSVRDDGPLPDVITEMVEAQRRMREAVLGVRLAVMLSTMLHSIATGNLLPAHVRTVCVDINPAVVTKLADRGSWQSVGLVTDVESFLRELVHVIEAEP